MIELRCPACGRYLGEFEGQVRLQSCPNCRSAVYAKTTTTGVDEIKFTLSQFKDRPEREVKVALG